MPLSTNGIQPQIDIDKQIEKIKSECLILTNALPYVKIKLEYNRNKKISDGGKFCITPIITNWTS